MKLDHGGLEGLDARGRNAYVRYAYGGLLDSVLPILADRNARSQLPVELLGDAFLWIVRDWYDRVEVRQVVSALIRLEQKNAEIVANLAAAEQAVKDGSRPKAAPVPTRKGKQKARAAAGRR